MSTFLDSLKARGLVHSCTDEALLSAHLAQPRRLYCGFDPTADSLTIGNLVPILLLRRFQLAGHTPYVLVGGATGLIGDPSGKEAERALRSPEEVQANIEGQRRIFERLLDFGEGSAAARIVNNHDWFAGIGFLQALRDIGKHFSVNEMVKRDSVRNRLENRDQGISYTEFSYMLIQAYDFLHLYREEGVSLQVAGSDQWGNIVSGVDLIRRAEGLDAEGNARGFGLTAPLITKADGSKFGKSEAGAVWLTADRTSPYRFYQFWLSTLDEDVVRYLKVFTLLPPEEIEGLAEAHAAAPQRREAHRRLAEEVTEAVHGAAARERAQAATQVLFSGDVRSQDLALLEEVFAEVPSSEHPRSALEGDGLALVELLPQTSLAGSKGEARRLLSQNGVSLNGEKVGPDRQLGVGDLLHGQLMVLRKGKGKYHLTRWPQA